MMHKHSSNELKELFLLCAGVVLLILAALILSTPASPLSSATPLGVAQGQPDYGEGYPSPLSCPQNTALCYPNPRVGTLSIRAAGASDGYTVNVDANNAQTSLGSPVILDGNRQLEVEWACLPYQNGTATCQIVNPRCHCSWWGGCGTCYTPYACNTGNITYTDNTLTSTGFQTNGALVGTASVTFPANADSFTYSLQCKKAGGSTYTVTNTVYAAGGADTPLNAPKPTATINAGNGNGVTKTVEVGTPVTITATYTPRGTDSLTSTAINGPNSTNSVPGVSNTTPDSPKQYIFIPSAVGTYTFAPAIRSANFPVWNDYGVAVDVVATPMTCPNAHGVNPPTCTCDVGYSGPPRGLCTQVPCSDPNALWPLCTSCRAGYELRGGVCTPPPELSLRASQLRVNSGTRTTVTWRVTRLYANAGIVCSLSSNPSGVVSARMPANTQPTWSGTAQTAPITATTVITLSCTGANPKSITVGLIPAFEEPPGV